MAGLDPATPIVVPRPIEVTGTSPAITALWRRGAQNQTRPRARRAVGRGPPASRAGRRFKNSLVANGATPKRWGTRSQENGFEDVVTTSNASRRSRRVHEKHFARRSVDGDMNQAAVLAEDQDLVDQRLSLAAQSAAHDLCARRALTGRGDGRLGLDHLALGDGLLDVSRPQTDFGRSRRGRGAVTCQERETEEA